MLIVIYCMFQAWQNRHVENEDDIDIQKPLFNVVGFTSKQVIKSNNTRTTTPSEQAPKSN